MLFRKGIRAAITACMLLALTAMTLLAQGVMRQEYSGLDKYMEQGRPDQISFAGVRAAEFLTIPIGARAIGLGSAFTAACDDITSIYWNPAGLGFLTNRQAMVNVVDYTLDLTYAFGAAAVPIADGRIVVGGFFGYLDVPEMEVTTVGSPNGTGHTFNAYDFQMGGSLAYNFSDRFVAGLNMKHVHQEVFSNVRGDAFAIDAGGIYHTMLMDREVKFAFSIQNLGTNITMHGPNLLHNVSPDLDASYKDYSSDPEAISRRNDRWMYYQTHTYRLPTAMKLAISYSLLTTEKTNWLAAGELWRNSNQPISFSSGSELSYSFTPYLSAALRAGWKVQRDEFTDDEDFYDLPYWGDDPTMRGLSLGGGIKRDFFGKSLEFSYAYRNKGRLSSDNFFTVIIGF